jgi:hypothetical protein
MNQGSSMMNDTIRMDVDGDHAEYGPFRISVDAPQQFLEPQVGVQFAEFVHQMLLPGRGVSDLQGETSLHEAMARLGFKDMNWRKAPKPE